MGYGECGTTEARIDWAVRRPESAMSSSARAPWEAFAGSAVGRRLRGCANLQFRKRIVAQVCVRFARPQTPSGGMGKGRRTTRTKKAKLSSVEADEIDPSPPRGRHGAPQVVTEDLFRRDWPSQPVSEPLPSPRRPTSGCPGALNVPTPAEISISDPAPEPIAPPTRSGRLRALV
jgi:hypothetical protein